MSDAYKFYSRVKVRFNETDLQGHVNFGQYLFYFDVGATEYMEAIGFDYDRILASGIDLVYAESHCNYHARVKWPETLRVHTRIAHAGRRSLRYEFDVRSEKDERQVATGHIVAISVERGNWAERELPNALKQAIEAYESSDAATTAREPA